MSQRRSQLMPHHPHRGEPVQVGPYTIYLTGTMYNIDVQVLSVADVIVPLTERIPNLPYLQDQEILSCCHLPDFGGVPSNWGDILREQIIPRLAAGRQILAFCAGSHGRTGTFLASLIAILEPNTRDPIAAARKRHCEHAVETRAQAEGIFALRGKALPRKYQNAFHR